MPTAANDNDAHMAAIEEAIKSLSALENNIAASTAVRNLTAGLTTYLQQARVRDRVDVRGELDQIRFILRKIKAP